MTKADHLRAAGRKVPEPDVPVAGQYLWEWFWELHSGRSYGFAANPITYAEIALWASLLGAEPTAAEVRVIKAMDIAFMAFRAKMEN